MGLVDEGLIMGGCGSKGLGTRAQLCGSRGFMVRKNGSIVKLREGGGRLGFKELGLTYCGQS